MSRISTRLSASVEVRVGDSPFGGCSASHIAETMEGIPCNSNPSSERSLVAIGGKPIKRTSLLAGSCHQLQKERRDSLCRSSIPSCMLSLDQDRGSRASRESVLVILSSPRPENA